MRILFSATKSRNFHAELRCHAERGGLDRVSEILEQSKVQKKFNDSDVVVKKGALANVEFVYSVFREVWGASGRHFLDFLRVMASLLECLPTTVATAVATAVPTAAPGLYRGGRCPPEPPLQGPSNSLKTRSGRLQDLPAPNLTPLSTTLQ